MSEQVLRCDECGCQNRLPEGRLIEAHCRRCESALTIYTIVIGIMRSRAVSRSLQAVVSVAILTAMFGGDIAEWWANEPFRLDGRVVQEQPVQASIIPSDSLAYEPELAENN